MGRCYCFIKSNLAKFKFNLTKLYCFIIWLFIKFLIIIYPSHIIWLIYKDIFIFPYNDKCALWFGMHLAFFNNGCWRNKIIIVRGNHGSLQLRTIYCIWSVETGCQKKTENYFIPAISKGHAWIMYHGFSVWHYCPVVGKNSNIFSAFRVWVRHGFVQQRYWNHNQQWKPCYF